MTSLTSLSSKQRLFIVSSVVLGTILLTASVLSSSGRRSQREVTLPSVTDSTGALHLISLERIERQFVTRMKNTSKKAITAYVKAVCDVPESSTDYTIGDDLIEPGEIVDITTSVQAVPDKCGVGIAQPNITILAVVFDDRTYAGEVQWATGILEDRRGNKIQLKRINRLLAKASKWPDVSQPVSLKRLKAEIAALPVDEEEAPAVRAGLSHAKQTALYLLGELEQWHTAGASRQLERGSQLSEELAGIRNLGEGFEKVMRLNEKWISKY